MIVIYRYIRYCIQYAWKFECFVILRFMVATIYLCRLWNRWIHTSMVYLTSISRLSVRRLGRGPSTMAPLSTRFPQVRINVWRFHHRGETLPVPSALAVVLYQRVRPKASLPQTPKYICLWWRVGALLRLCLAGVIRRVSADLGPVPEEGFNLVSDLFHIWILPVLKASDQIFAGLINFTHPSIDVAHV